MASLDRKTSGDVKDPDTPAIIENQPVAGGPLDSKAPPPTGSEKQHDAPSWKIPDDTGPAFVPDRSPAPPDASFGKTLEGLKEVAEKGKSNAEALEKFVGAEKDFVTEELVAGAEALSHNIGVVSDVINIAADINKLVEATEKENDGADSRDASREHARVWTWIRSA